VPPSHLEVEMPGEEAANVEVVRRLYEAMAERDIETMLSLFDPEVTLHQPGDIPWGGTYGGHDGLGDFFLTLIGTITSAVTTEGIFGAGDRVVQMGRTAGTVNATGQPFDIAEVHVFTLAGGRIVRYEPMIDVAAMQAALAAG
jgi:uncharacterized protein